MTISAIRRLFGRADAKAGDLHFDYQPAVDLLYAWTGEPQVAENVEVEPGVYVRVVSGQGVVGIEILDCASRFNVTPAAIDQEFAQQKLREYAERPAVVERLSA